MATLNQINMIHISSSLRALLEASNCQVGKLFLTSEKVLEVGNYFSFREAEGTISYCPANKEQEIGEDGRWLRKSRVDIRAGRLIKKIFGTGDNPLPDAEIELFVNKFKALEEDSVDFKIATTATEIDDAYDRAAVDSCMKGQEVGPFYSKVGAKVLYAEKKGNVIGRAVLWPKVETSGGEIKLMDRIYGQDAIVQMFKNYADENGYYSLAFNGGACGVAQYDGKKVDLGTVPITKFPSVDWYPYMDTFSYATSRYLTTESGQEYWLLSTDGDCKDPDDHDGEVWSEYHDEYIDGDDAVMIDGDWRRMDDCVRLENGDWKLEDNCTQTHDGRWFLTEETREVTIGKTTYIVHEDDIS